MKIVMIGASGHWSICVPESFCEDRAFAAIAPGSPGEPLEEMRRRLCEAGYAPVIYQDYREMLRKEKPDAAVVDNFYGQHAQVILDAFAAGCHVLSEKPAAVDLMQLERIEEAWRRAGTVFSSMFTYRYDGAFCLAKNLIGEGAIGRIQLLCAQKSYKLGNRPAFMMKRETYGGTIPWVGIHAIDWILWMSGGSFESVTALQSAAAAPNGACPETAAAAQFRMNGGMLASLTVDYLNPETALTHGDDRIRVAGTKGVLEVRGGRVILTNSAGITYPEHLSGGDLFGDFLRQIKGEGRCRISAEDVFAATRAALLAQSAADSGKIVYFRGQRIG